MTNSCNLGHLDLRTRNWYLRMASKKQMAALFTAFNILCCEKLNIQHIDVCKCPCKPVLNALQQGGFYISFRRHTHKMDECIVAITNLYSSDNVKCVVTFLLAHSIIYSLTCEQVMKLLSSSTCVKGYSCEVVSVGPIKDQLLQSM